ncbi:IS3 family transposase [Streptomyces sp. NPDC058646]|uniref:IS3 family transposase n=1 Tax=Streptomyces sp. NPDC058646 TaxID=3346574 RepID=UPI003662842E
MPASTYYRWRRGDPCHHKLRDAELTEQIRRVHAESDGSYGSPRVHAVLKREGVSTGRKRVERLMRQAGLQGVSPRRPPSFPASPAGIRPPRPLRTWPSASSPRMPRTGCGSPTSP